MTFPTDVKIILRSSVTPELILQLTALKNYLKSVDFCMFQEVFVDFLKKGKFNQRKYS